MAIFISAFLLFQVQLIIGKRVLPWFGGAPAVWTTCMLAFQALLLAGYGYAHALNAMALRRQRVIHGVLLMVAMLCLAAGALRWGVPLLPAKAPASSADSPVGTIFWLLMISVAVPFFVLSTTSPLLQRWYAVSGGGSPYRLYAASNAGSMLGLLSYPFIVEPLLQLRAQAWIWSGAFVTFALVCWWCWRRLPDEARPSAGDDQDAALPPARADVALWVLLSAVTSAALLSVTNTLCQDIAVVPFLWVLPLVLYLLSFILCFESTRWYRRRWYVLALAAATVAVMITNVRGVTLKVPVHIVAYGAFLFLLCMTCHGELVRLKPGSRSLTAFYLAIAAGGATGALFVGIGAPLWFEGFWELHVTALASWIVLAVVFWRDRTSFFFKGDRACLLLLLAIIGYVVLKLAIATHVLALGPLAPYEPWLTPGFALAFAAVVFAVLRARGAGQSRFWPRILVGAMVFIVECFFLSRVRSAYSSSIEVERNFFGSIRVSRHDVPGEAPLPALYLSHGHISHGMQFLDPEFRALPSAYYSTNSGLGIAMRLLPRRATPEAAVNIGVLGLGAGTIAAFARENDAVRFYEINPAVIALNTRAEPRFTYLRDCRGRVEVVAGDARLSLEHELARRQRGNFDVLVMDAFSSDSVPVHLLTVEAFETYLAHMRDEHGIIAVNISNRFLDFRDLMAAIAARFHMQAVIIDSRGDPPDRTPSRWCLFTRDAAFADLPAIARARMAYTPKPVPVWTDQFSNMLRLLR